MTGMKRLRSLAPAAVLILATAMPAAAASLEDGRWAYRTGDYSSAFAVFETLARDGDPEAKFWLGTMFYQGRGQPRSFRDALVWYQRAAYDGNAEAQNNLGLMHRNGEGVAASPVAAYAWFSLASQTSQVARDNLARVVQDFHMSRDQVLEGQQLTQDYRQRIEDRRQRRLAAAEAAAAQPAQAVVAEPVTPPPAPVPVVAVQTAALPPPLPPPARRAGPAGQAASGDRQVFLVQIGLFRDPDNVTRIRDTLGRRKLHPIDEFVTLGGKGYRRLRIGPYPDADQAAVAASMVNDLFSLQSAVIPVLE